MIHESQNVVSPTRSNCRSKLGFHRVGSGGSINRRLYGALGRSVAQLSAAEKNAQSHRALAAADLVRQLREAWHLADMMRLPRQPLEGAQPLLGTALRDG